MPYQVRFCPTCGFPVARSAIAPAGAPESAGSAQRKQKWFFVGGVLGIAVLVVIGLAAFYILVSSRPPSTVTYILITPTAPAYTDARIAELLIPSAVFIPTVVLQPTQAPAGTASAAAVVATPTATTLMPARPSALSTPLATATVTETTAAYDLYVKSIDYVLKDSDGSGQEVHFNVVMATNTYPQYGPFFPATHFRLRGGAKLDWHEGACQASDRFESCYASFDVMYIQPGTYDVTVEVDPRGEVPETDESNNRRTITLQVSAESASATETLTPLPPPTLTAIPTAIPTRKPQPVFSAVTFSSEFDDGALVPINPATTFPYGVQIIYAYWTYSGVVPDTAFDYAWFRDGTYVDGSGERFVSASGKSFQWLVYGYTPTTPLDAGNYQFVVHLNGQVIASGKFVIEESQLGAPIPDAISVFFTIQNGNPIGWVYDKQAVKHVPQYGTISDLHIQPGDRIVLQTDQTRFSLLFDCSTTAGTFDPCNFSSDSTANLPGEIRAVKNGMSGFLNISRADNWASYRPGFEPQRYPADPVLRIVFSW